MIEARSRAKFSFDRDDLGDPEDVFESVYINSCHFAGAAITYCVKITFRANIDNPTQFQSIGFTPLDARAEVSDLQDYAEDMANQHQIRVIVHPANLVEVTSSQAGVGKLSG